MYSREKTRRLVRKRSLVKNRACPNTIRGGRIIADEVLMSGHCDSSQSSSFVREWMFGFSF